MKRLEDNYISVVLVAENCADYVIDKVNNLKKILTNNFKNYEIIIVDNMSTDDTLRVLKESSLSINIIHLPQKHGSQQALNAGISIAIGDYLVEVEDINNDVDFKLIIDMYRKCQEGYDFVFLTPKKIKFTSTIFYNMLNKHFKNQFSSNISSTLMTLSSRRGQNKVAEVGGRIINRNVHYAISGLKSFSISCDFTYSNNRGWFNNTELMLDTLIHHTNIVTRFAQRVSILFFVFSIAVIIYSLLAKIFIDTVSGWASTLIFINLGFSALFLMLAIMSRYLHHIIQNTTDSKDYIYREIIKKNE